MPQNDEEFRKRADEFLISFARAVLTWQSIEESLFLVYSTVIGARGSSAAGAAFWSVINFNARLEMTDAAAQERFKGNALLEDWDALVKKIKKRARNRNQLAHFRISAETKKGKGAEYFDLVVTDSFFKVNPRTHKSGRQIKYDKESLDALTVSFRQLNSRINQFISLSASYLIPS